MPTNPNPYRPPAGAPASERHPATQILATPHARFLAVFLDELVVAVVVGAILWKLGLLGQIERVFDEDLDMMVTIAALGIVVWLALQIPFLLRGQTLGKRIVGIRMVDHASGGPVPLGRILVLRYLPFMLAGCIPLVGRIILLTDLTMISRRGRRCLHDHLAGTRVVET